MMANLPMCTIPEEMSWALKMRFHNNKKSYAIIADEIYGSPLLKVLVPRLFQEYIKNNNLESMLNALGWNGFRDRLGAIYLYKMEYGEFPTQIELEAIREIKQFEDQFRDYVPDGDSRMFMLGFYLKMCDFKLNQDFQYMSESLLKTSESILKIFKKGTQKSIKLDWIYITLKVLEEMISPERLESVINESNGNFYKVYQDLSQEDQRVLIQSLMAYGGSINESEIFIYDRV